MPMYPMRISAKSARSKSGQLQLIHGRRLVLTSMRITHLLLSSRPRRAVLPFSQRPSAPTHNDSPNWPRRITRDARLQRRRCAKTAASRDSYAISTINVRRAIQKKNSTPTSVTHHVQERRRAEMLARPQRIRHLQPYHAHDGKLRQLGIPCSDGQRKPFRDIGGNYHHEQQRGCSRRDPASSKRWYGFRQLPGKTRRHWRHLLPINVHFPISRES